MPVFITGIEDLHRSLTTLQNQLENTLLEVVSSGAEVIEREIASRVPEKTGRLKTNLLTTSVRQQNSARTTVEMAHSRPEESEHYAIFQEFGSSKMPAHPFFRPGIEAAKPQIKTVVNQALQKTFADHVD